jgi:hypothetical protein
VPETAVFVNLTAAGELAAKPTNSGKSRWQCDISMIAMFEFDGRYPTLELSATPKMSGTAT